jgi:hypothetical protein
VQLQSHGAELFFQIEETAHPIEFWKIFEAPRELESAHDYCRYRSTIGRPYAAGATEEALKPPITAARDADRIA